MKRPSSSRLSSSPATAAKRVVWAVTLLHVALMLAYSVLFASFRGPDEPQHTDLIRFVKSEADYPAFDERRLGTAVFRALDEVRFDVPAVRSRDLPEAEAPLRSGRPSFEVLGSDLETVPDEANQLPSHPPLYYGLAAGYLTAIDWVVPGSDLLAFDQEVGFLRLLGVLMLAPLPLLAWAVSRRLGSRPVTGAAASIAVLAVPQLHHIGASVSNDNLLTLLVGIVTLLCVRVATGESGIRLAVILGLVTGAALLTKAFALFLPLMIVVAYAISVRRGTAWRTAATSAGIAGLVAFAAGGWWWARNLIVFGQIQTGIKLLDAAPEGFQPDVGWWVSRYLRFIPWRFWGWFGWFDVALPALVVVLATALVLVAVLRALAKPPAGPDRIDLLLLLVPTGAIAGLVAVGAFQGYLRTSFDEGLQGRYLFPGLVGLAVVVASGLGKRGWMPGAVLAFAAAMQAVAVVTILRFYWGGSPVVGELRAALAWSPWRPPFLVVGAAILVGAAIWTTFEVIRFARVSRTRIIVP